MYEQLFPNNMGSSSFGFMFWSSSEDNRERNWVTVFSDTESTSRGTLRDVRPVRMFYGYLKI
jgi:hypothetical protein